MKSISVVTPIYCEEAVVEEFYRRTKAVLCSLGDRYGHEIVFVDDGSTDRSMTILMTLVKNDPLVRVIELSRNFGHQSAITAGIEHASGDAVVIIDGDLQDPPELIPQMIEKWEDGNGVVYACRKRRRGEGRFKLVSAKAFYRLLNKLSDIEIPLDTGDFRLIDWRVVEALKGLPEKNRFIRGLIPWVGFPQYGLKYERDERYAGKTKYTLGKSLRLAFDGITGFSEKPLYISFQIGLFISGIAVIAATYLVIRKLFAPETVIQGWTSMSLVLLFLGGLQFIFIGIVGVYLGRIFREVKQRPVYLVAGKYGFGERLDS